MYCVVTRAPESSSLAALRMMAASASRCSVSFAVMTNCASFAASAFGSTVRTKRGVDRPI